MTLTPEDLVHREVHYCVSGLVATLAGAAYNLPSKRHGMVDPIEELGALAEQALELAAPIDDWEEAAAQAGWSLFKGTSQANGLWRCIKNAAATDDDVTLWADSAEDAWRAACELDSLEPYQREVFEHWLVSDWLADKLIEEGEKVDKDLAGLTVWARTTTGQAISMDSVIERIAAKLNAPEAEG